MQEQIVTPREYLVKSLNRCECGGEKKIRWGRRNGGEDFAMLVLECTICKKIENHKVEI